MAAAGTENRVKQPDARKITPLKIPSNLDSVSIHPRESGNQVLDRYDLNYMGQELKDVRAKNFQSIDCFKIYLRQEKQKTLGVIDFVSETKRVENYPDLEKLAHVIQHGLQGFMVKNIEGESTEANDVSHIL